MINQTRMRAQESLFYISIVVFVYSATQSLGLLDWQSSLDRRSIPIAATLFLLLMSLIKFFTTERNLSVISTALAISVVSIVNWKVYQIGSIPFTGYTILTLTAAAIFLPKKILLPALVTIVGLFWINLNYLSIGVVNSDIDTRTLFSLIVLIWPLHTLVTAEQIDEEVKARAIKQGFAGLLVAGLLFYFVFSSWG